MTQPRTLSTPADVPARRGRGPLLISGAVFSLGGGTILLVVIAGQLQASLVYGGVFAVVGIAQVGLAVALLAAPARGRVVGAAAVSLAVIAVWVLARTVGLPGPGPWLPVDTAVGFTDYLCLALEALAALLLVCRPPAGRGIRWCAAGSRSCWPACRVRPGPVRRPDSAVQAVVDMFGAADLTDLGDSDGFTRTITRVALGGSASVRRSASPLSYLGPDALAGGAVGGTSHLILHGTDDHSVRPRHSREFARRLAAAGSPVELVLVRVPSTA
jgi:hypothetical protein